jgi:hypothetical protein
MMGVPYAVVGDEQVYSRAPVRAQTMWALARNAQHLPAECSRVVSSGDMSVDLTGLADVQVKIPLYIGPLDRLYRVQLAFAATLVAPDRTPTVEWWVSTEDAVGAGHAAVNTYHEVTPVIGNQVPHVPGIPAIDHIRPWMSTVYSGWQIHTCDPDGDAFRMLIIHATQQPATGSRIYLSGITAVGYTDGQGVW